MIVSLCHNVRCIAKACSVTHIMQRAVPEYVALGGLHMCVLDTGGSRKSEVSRPWMRCGRTSGPVDIPIDL